jgi:hypothetical protein
MMAIYISMGLLVSLILSWNSRTGQSISAVNKPSLRIALAVLLTSLFWPVVLIMAYFDSLKCAQNKRITLISEDLVQPVNIDAIEKNHVLPLSAQAETLYTNKRVNEQWHSLKLKKRSHNKLWSFRTEQGKNNNRPVYEGYALVDRDLKIVDYMIVDSYGNQEQSSHIIH